LKQQQQQAQINHICGGMMHAFWIAISKRGALSRDWHEVSFKRYPKGLNELNSKSQIDAEREAPSKSIVPQREPCKQDAASIACCDMLR
jgi:hypothetical protein